MHGWHKRKLLEKAESEMMSGSYWIGWIGVLHWIAFASRFAYCQEVFVQDSAGLVAAIQAAAPGTRIRLASGDYPGGLSFKDVQGVLDKPIEIAAVDPARPPRIVGGSNNLQFSNAAHLILSDLLLTGGTGNGLNIDDGGRLDSPSHHIALRNLRISNVNVKGNHDAVKLSGVADFSVDNCVFERWGGQAIDMVGCHRGVIEGCRFLQSEDVSGSIGVQTKGGSSKVQVRRCYFNRPIERGVNLGGSTGLQFFRPKVQGYEAKDILVEGCIFDGCHAAVAFVGVDGGVVRFNTIYRPRRWVTRILQENNAPGFVPSRNGVFEDNVIVFRSDNWSEGGVNVGGNTAPETFRFARNVWYCEDRPDRSKPNLPTKEVDGIVGLNPLLKDPEKGDFGLSENSPAAKQGASAMPGS
jgi:hypothetical protein